MNSKGIFPRVGMQITFLDWDQGPKKIHAIHENGKIDCFRDGKVIENESEVNFFVTGKYEIDWTPPTDEERAMFRAAALGTAWAMP